MIGAESGGPTRTIHYYSLLSGERFVHQILRENVNLSLGTESLPPWYQDDTNPDTFYTDRAGKHNKECFTLAVEGILSLMALANVSRLDDEFPADLYNIYYEDTVVVNSSLVLFIPHLTGGQHEQTRAQLQRYYYSECINVGVLAQRAQPTVARPS